MADTKRVRTYAPGYGLFIPKSSAAGPRDCPGCDVGDAPSLCAACGKPTAVVLPPIRIGNHPGYLGHALPLCLRCYAVVHEWREEAAAAKAHWRGGRPKRQKQRSA